MNHIFPFSEINKGERIVLYGASERGYDFYRQLISTQFVNVVLWVDRQYEWYRYMNLPVDNPKKIQEVLFDRIIVTAENESVYRSIRYDLKELSVDDAKIYWKPDCRIKGNLALKYDSERVRRESQNAYQMNPRSFLESDRLDIVIRVLYAVDIINGAENVVHEKMYRKLMMVQNDGKEPTENMMSAFFTEYSIKRGWKAFDGAFRELISSINIHGFEREYFVALDKSKHMINGAHRVAAAMAIGTDVWVYDYPVYIKPLIFNDKWLKNHGFSKSETDYIIKKYLELLV